MNPNQIPTVFCTNDACGTISAPNSTTTGILYAPQPLPEKNQMNDFFTFLGIIACIMVAAVALMLIIHCFITFFEMAKTVRQLTTRLDSTNKYLADVISRRSRKR